MGILSKAAERIVNYINKLKKTATDEDLARMQYLEVLGDGLADNMSLSELAQKIDLLENAKFIVKGLRDRVVTLEEMLHQNNSSPIKTLHKQVKEQFAHITNQTLKTLPDRPFRYGYFSHEFFSFLQYCHQALLKAYYDYTEKVVFNEQQINQSTHLNWLARKPSDNADTVLADLGRGITIKDQEILNNASNENKLEAIKTLTTDEAKIQAIMGIHRSVYADFNNAFVSNFNYKDKELFAAGKGTIIWDKESEPFARVESYINLLIDKKTGDHYVLDQDTRQLVRLVEIGSLNRDEYDVIEENLETYDYYIVDKKTNQREKVKDIMLLNAMRTSAIEIVPRICTLHGRIDLTKTSEGYSPYLTEFLVELSAPEFQRKNQYIYTPSDLENSQALNTYQAAIEQKYHRMDENSLGVFGKTVSIEGITFKPQTTDEEKTRIITDFGEKEYFAKTFADKGYGNYIIKFGGNMLSKALEQELKHSIQLTHPSLSNNNNLDFITDTKVVWSKDSRGIFANGEVSVYAIKVGQDYFVADPKTNTLRKASPAQLDSIEEKDFHGMPPICQLKTLVELDDSTSTIKPVFKDVRIIMNSQDVSVVHATTTANQQDPNNALNNEPGYPQLQH